MFTCIGIIIVRLYLGTKNPTCCRRGRRGACLPWGAARGAPPTWRRCRRGVVTRVTHPTRVAHPTHPRAAVHDCHACAPPPPSPRAQPAGQPALITLKTCPRWRRRRRSRGVSTAATSTPVAAPRSFRSVCTHPSWTRVNTSSCAQQPVPTPLAAASDGHGHGHAHAFGRGQRRRRVRPKPWPLRDGGGDGGGDAAAASPPLPTVATW